MRRYKIIIVFSLLLIGCQKQKAKKYSGIYNCQVSYSVHEFGEVPIDTTYMEDVEIASKHESIVVLGHTIKVDDLIKNEFFPGTLLIEKGYIKSISRETG